MNDRQDCCQNGYPLFTAGHYAGPLCRSPTVLAVKFAALSVFRSFVFGPFFDKQYIVSFLILPLSGCSRKREIFALH